MYLRVEDDNALAISSTQELLLVEASKIDGFGNAGHRPATFQLHMRVIVHLELCMRWSCREIVL